MLLGWDTFYVTETGDIADTPTKWAASCFMIFWIIIYMGKVKLVTEL